MISVCFQGKPFNITVIQVYALTNNAGVERFYEDLQDFLELTPPKRCPFHCRGLECKSRKSRATWSSRLPGVTGRFGFEVQNKADQTINFQVFKLGLEKAEEPEIKLPTFVRSLKKLEFQKNIYFCFIDYAKAFDCRSPQTGKFFKRWE